MRDKEMHAIAAIGAAVTTALFVAAPLVYAGEPATPQGPQLAELEAIEATLAYKAETLPPQPQKKFRAPEEKPLEGVSRDEKKTPETKPEEKKPDNKQDLESEYEKLRRQRGGEDDPLGKPTPEEIGAFDGSQFGFAEESRGDPYFQALVRDVLERWELPEIVADAGALVGCVQMAADGRIKDTLFKEKSTNNELNDSVERALASVQKARSESPDPVPNHLLKAATTKWVCFKFRARK